MIEKDPRRLPGPAKTGEQAAPNPVAERATQALQGVIQSDENVALLDRFRTTYEYRRQFSWLPESGQSPVRGEQDGLVNAVRSALFMYTATPEPEIEGSEHHTPVGGVWRDPAWEARLTKAASQAMNDETMRSLTMRLARRGVQVEQATAE